MTPNGYHRCLAWLLALIGLNAGEPARAAAPALDLHFEQRARVEAVTPQYRPDFPPSDRALALRTSLRLDAIWPRSRVLVEFMDARSHWTPAGAPVTTTLVNTFELIQAAAIWQPNGGSGHMLRVGLLTKDIGSRRLVARNRFRNTVNAFAGIDWEWEGPTGLAINAFFLRPMRRLPADSSALAVNRQQRDEIGRDSGLAGVEIRGPIGRATAQALLLHSYGAETRVPSDDRQDLWTLSLRALRLPQTGRLDFEVEAVVQGGELMPAGRVRSLSHRANFIHLAFGYTPSLAGRPWMGLEYDRASGDDDPDDLSDQRFDTLYGARRFELGPSGIFGPFVRSNLEAFGVRLRLAPTAAVSWLVAYRGYRLASARDAWVVPGIRDESGGSGTMLGTQLETALSWHLVPDRWILEFGGAYLRFGRFALTAPGTTGRDDSTYVYSQLLYRYDGHPG